jgi:hypothetical protein
MHLLSKRFDDPHRRVKAEDELAKLTMKPFGDFTMHVSEFIRLANVAQLSKELWKNALHKTLYSKLKTALALQRSSPRTDFEEYCEDAQELAYAFTQENNESRERRENAKQRQQARDKPTSKPPQNSSPSTTQPDKPRGTQGGQNPRVEVKCYTCGKKGHIAPNCPDKKKDNLTVKAVEPAELPAHNDPDSDSEN